MEQAYAEALWKLIQGGMKPALVVKKLRESLAAHGRLALLPKIAKKRKDVKKGRFSLGDEVLNLNLDKSADAIVFIRGQGQKLTKGKTAFTLLVGGLPAYLQLTIGVVDAHTGEVLVFTNPLTRGDATGANDKSLLKAIENSLKKLPPNGQ